MSAYAQVGGQPNTPAMLIAAVTRPTHSNCKRRRLMPACGRVRQAGIRTTIARMFDPLCCTFETFELTFQL
jgi:hypothetical protein